MAEVIERRHNWRQPCTKRADCDCSECCLCRECLFDRRSASMYRGMKSRLREKKWKSGKREGQVRIEARPIPYSIDQFRAWLRCVLEDTPRCEYCEEPIDIMTISPDHATPMNRGGSLELANLRGACERCNTLKGSLLPGEFKALLAGLKTFTEDGRKDIIRRLMGAAVHFHRPKAGGKPPKQVEARPPTDGVLAFPPLRGAES